MNTKHLISLLAVCKCSSISKAAKSLNYSQSTIYDQLSALESELVTKLYTRAPHGIKLTTAGIEFLPFAEKILEVYDDAMGTFTNEVSSVRISASESTDFAIMDILIKEYIRKFPDIYVEYSKMTTDVSQQKIISLDCDVSFVCEPESALKNIGDLQIIKQFACEAKGIAILPSSAIKAELESGQLVPVSELNHYYSFNVYILTPLASKSTKAVKDFISLAFELFGE